MQFDPAAAALVVPKGVPYIAVPQYGGYVTEYGAARTLQADWMLNSLLGHNPLEMQLRPGGAPDWFIRGPFQDWGVKPFDSTTLGEATRKTAEGKDYNFAIYQADWQAVRLKLGF
jgi:hypothetical protein